MEPRNLHFVAQQRKQVMPCTHVCPLPSTFLDEELDTGFAEAHVLFFLKLAVVSEFCTGGGGACSVTRTRRCCLFLISNVFGASPGATKSTFSSVVSESDRNPSANAFKEASVPFVPRKRPSASDSHKSRGHLLHPFESCAFVRGCGRQNDYA